jgi:hypothetical protein
VLLVDGATGGCTCYWWMVMLVDVRATGGWCYWWMVLLVDGATGGWCYWWMVILVDVRAARGYRLIVPTTHVSSHGVRNTAPVVLTCTVQVQ